MTFVAQPYERFADDLLAGLTGGVIREEYRFLKEESSRSLASSDALGMTLKVFGQRNNAFKVFTQGIDFAFDASKGVITWKPEGQTPDDHSYYYVNYYRKEAQAKLNDRNPGSVTTTFAEAFGREWAVASKQMEMIYRSAFVDLATGTSLDHVAALLGLERKDAKFASGEILLKRSSPATGDIVVPAGTIVSTDAGQNYETTDKRTLRKGQLSVTASIRAQIEGPAGIIEANTIKNVNRPIFGIETVVNERPTFFATAKESDDQFRLRIKSTLERAGRSTLTSIKYSLIEEIPGVNDGNVQVSEDPAGPGKVEVKFALGGKIDQDLVRRIEESIFNARPAGVRVVHNLPTLTKPDTGETEEHRATPITREMALAHFHERGEPREIVKLTTDEVARLPEGMLPLQIEVLVSLTQSNVSAAEKERIEDEVRNRIVNYIESLPMGSDVIYNKLIALVIQSDDIADAAVLVAPVSSDGGATQAGYQANISSGGRKATVDSYHVYVDLVGEKVLLDVLVKLEPVAQKADVQVTPELEGNIKKAILDVVKTADQSLSKMVLREAVRSVVEQNKAELQLVQDNALILNASFEETGRVLNNPDKVDIAPHQRFELKDPKVSLAGALDG